MLSRRAFSTATSAPLRVCIVGTGPGGFYTAKYLLKSRDDIIVDMIDALPTPFGLVRSGVAPDHPEVKNVEKDFSQVAEDERLGFVGNVVVGEDVGVSELSEQYHAVVLAYGASSDWELGVAGEELDGVFSARTFVNWYNGHPDYAHVDFGSYLRKAEDVVVIGHGNVAVDCARILSESIDVLAKTDITSDALDALEASSVRRVSLLGRRGPVQSAFTRKELRELCEMESAHLFVDPADLEQGLNPASEEELGKKRAMKRIMQLLEQQAEKFHHPPPDVDKHIHLRYFRSPVGFVEEEGGGGRVGGLRVAEMKLEGEVGSQRAVPTGKEEVIPASLVLRSIGYKSTSIDASVPFNTKRHVVQNAAGRVVDDTNTPVPGLYCAGWAKRGPTGIIASNIMDAKQTVSHLLEDAASDLLPTPLRPSPVTRPINTYIPSWEAWKRIDKAEIARGAPEKPREKYTRIQDMLEVGNGLREQ